MSLIVRQRKPVARAINLLLALTLYLGLCASTPLAQQQRWSQSQQGGAPKNNQVTAQPGQAERAVVEVLAEADKDYLIAPGDLLEITVEDAPELSHRYRVTAAGAIELKIIGKLTASRKTTGELARVIAARLKEQEYLQNPHVMVEVQSYTSQTFFIQGAVNRPGVYQLEGRPPLLKMISLAGGLAENHGSTGFILRAKAKKPELTVTSTDIVETTGTNSQTTPQQSNAESAAAVRPAGSDNDSEGTVAADYDLIRVNLAALYKGRFDQNYLLEPGDIVNVPRADVFFVAGEVNAPGSYPLKEGTTLRQAISLAQGTTFKAKLGRGVIFREDSESGKRQELKIDIGAVLGGQQDDLPIQPNDVIIVPNSRTKSVSGALLTALGANSARLPIRY